MIDFTKPVQTRCGLKARIICTDRKSRGGYHVVALVAVPNEDEATLWFSTDGESEVGYQLVNVPVKHKRWINIYKDTKGDPYLSTHSSSTKGEADANAGLYRIACIEIEFEEGQGL